MSSEAPPASWDGFARQLGLEVQRRRIAAGKTQEDLAHQAGLTRSHYQGIEKGTWSTGPIANPTIKVLARLAQALELEIGDLLPAVSQIVWTDDL